MTSEGRHAGLGAGRKVFQTCCVLFSYGFLVEDARAYDVESKNECKVYQLSETQRALINIAKALDAIHVTREDFLFVLLMTVVSSLFSL